MNFADETRESSSSDGWKLKEDEEDEENAKHIGELKSNDRPTRKRRRTPPRWEWKKRRRRDGVKAAISRLLFVVRFLFVVENFARERKRSISAVKKQKQMNTFSSSKRGFVGPFFRVSWCTLPWQTRLPISQLCVCIQSLLLVSCFSISVCDDVKRNRYGIVYHIREPSHLRSPLDPHTSRHVCGKLSSLFFFTRVNPKLAFGATQLFSFCFFKNLAQKTTRHFFLSSFISFDERG